MRTRHYVAKEREYSRTYGMMLAVTCKGNALMPSDAFRKLMQLQTAAEFASEEDPYLSARLNYEAECQKFGIDPRLGLLDPLAYALEVVTRMGPDDRGPSGRS